MNLSKDNNTSGKVSLNKETNGGVNLNKQNNNDNQQNNMQNGYMDNGNGYNGNGNGYNGNGFDNIDMNKVHEAEENASKAISEGIENIAEQVSGAFNKATERFNNFVDNLDKPNMQNQNMNTQNQGMYGQDMNNQNMQNQGMNMQNQGMNMQNNYNNSQQEMVTPDKLKLEPVVAALVSFLLTGLGQMINGQLEKGLTLLIGGVIAVTIISLVTCGIGAITAPLLIAVSVIDAYKCAQILQSGRPIGKWEFHIFD